MAPFFFSFLFLTNQCCSAFLLSHEQLGQNSIGAGADVHNNPPAPYYQHPPTASMMLLATIGVGDNTKALGGGGHGGIVTVCLRGVSRLGMGAGFGSHLTAAVCATENAVHASRKERFLEGNLLTLNE